MDRKNIIEYVYTCEDNLKDEFRKYEHISFYNSMKVLNAFHDNKVSESHLQGTTGYGYNDYGRDVVEAVYANVFKCEDALVRNQLISGTHALAITLSALLRPNDTMISITGEPYDTLQTVIGCNETESKSSLKAFGIIL